jgi:pimeloyl-ACP methyl ester carboxylesterase
MKKVISADGTSIAYDSAGDGPPVILVDGAFGSRSMGPNQALAKELATDFTVITYDRRGRGESGDAPRSSFEPEVEDIAAVLEAVGGSACLYGISSGGALALEAACRLSGIARLALYEVPYVVDGTRAPVPRDYLAHLDGLLAAGRRADAVRYFMRTGVGVPPAVVAMMRFMPAWRKLKAVAHTLPYDTILIVDNQEGRPLPAERWAGATQPTLVVSGGKSPEWTRNAMSALARTLPDAEHDTLEGQTHLVKAKALAPVLRAFFLSGGAARATGAGSRGALA